MSENKKIYADAHKISSVFADLQDLISSSTEFEEVKTFIVNIDHWFTLHILICLIFYKIIQFDTLMVNWNNGLSLNITDKTSAALKKQLFDFYESITRPPNNDFLKTTNENWDLLHENYILRLGLIIFVRFLRQYEFRLNRYRWQI